MKLLIAFVLRYFKCLAGSQFLNIGYVRRLTISPLSPFIYKMLINLTGRTLRLRSETEYTCQEFHSHYQIIITIFTIGKNKFEASCCFNF